MPLFETQDEEGRYSTAVCEEDPYNPPLFPTARCSLIETVLYIMELKSERHWAAADVTALLKVLGEALLPVGTLLEFKGVSNVYRQFLATPGALHLQRQSKIS
jgi:hypothetical protein